MRRFPVLPVLLVGVTVSVVWALSFAFVSNGVLAPGGDEARPESSPEQAVSSAPEPEPEPATAQLGADTETIGEPLPDPTESGPCRLIVRATDHEVRPFEGQIDLWRLAAPGNDGWNAGDQRQARVAGDGGRYVFDDLPPGRYRMHAHGQRKGSDDPPAFEVAGDLTEAAFELPGLREHRVFFKVYDQTGRPVESARLEQGRRGSGYTQGRTPKWIVPRTPRNPDGWFGIGLGGGAGGSSGRIRRDALADYRGFDLGTHVEDARYRSTHSSFTVKVPGHSKAVLRLTNDVLRERTYVSVVVPLQLLSERVFLPTGECAVDAGAEIRASCEARLLTDTTPAEIWRTIPIQVHITLDGFEPLEDEFALDDGDWTMTLTPTSTD